MGKLSNTTQEIDEALQSVRKVLGDGNFYRDVTMPPEIFFDSTGTDTLTAMAKDFWKTNQEIQVCNPPFKSFVNGSPMMGVMNYATCAYDWVKEHGLLLTIAGNQERGESYRLTKCKVINSAEYTVSNTKYPDLLEYKTFYAKIEGEEYQIIRFTRYNNENVFYSSPSYVKDTKALRCYKLTYNNTAATLAERFVIEPVETGDQGVEVSIVINMENPAENNVNRLRSGDIASRDVISEALPRGIAAMSGIKLGHVIACIAVTIDGKLNRIYSYMSWGNTSGDYTAIIWKSQPIMLSGKMYEVSFVEHTAQAGQDEGWFTDVTMTEIALGDPAQFTEEEKAVLDEVIAENSVGETRINGQCGLTMPLNALVTMSNQPFFQATDFGNITMALSLGRKVYVNIGTKSQENNCPWLRIITEKVKESDTLYAYYTEPYFYKGEYYTMKITSTTESGANIRCTMLKLTDSAREAKEAKTLAQTANNAAPYFIRISTSLAADGTEVAWATTDVASLVRSNSPAKPVFVSFSCSTLGSYQTVRLVSQFALYENFANVYYLVSEPIKGMNGKTYRLWAKLDSSNLTKTTHISLREDKERMVTEVDLTDMAGRFLTRKWTQESIGKTMTQLNTAFDNGDVYFNFGDGIRLKMTSKYYQYGTNSYRIEMEDYVYQKRRYRIFLEASTVSTSTMSVIRYDTNEPFHVATGEAEGRIIGFTKSNGVINMGSVSISTNHACVELASILNKGYLEVSGDLRSVAGIPDVKVYVGIGIMDYYLLGISGRLITGTTEEDSKLHLYSESFVAPDGTAMRLELIFGIVDGALAPETAQLIYDAAYQKAMEAETKALEAQPYIAVCETNLTFNGTEYDFEDSEILKAMTSGETHRPMYVWIETAFMTGLLRMTHTAMKSGYVYVCSEPFFDSSGRQFRVWMRQLGSTCDIDKISIRQDETSGNTLPVDVEVDLGSITSTIASSSTSGIPFSSLHESRYRLKATTSDNSAIYLSMYAATDNWLVTTPYNGRAILVTKYENSDDWMRRSYTLAEINTQTGVTVFPGATSGGFSGM